MKLRKTYYPIQDTYSKLQEIVIYLPIITYRFESLGKLVIIY